MFIGWGNVGGTPARMDSRPNGGTRACISGGGMDGGPAVNAPSKKGERVQSAAAAAASLLARLPRAGAAAPSPHTRLRHGGTWLEMHRRGHRMGHLTDVWTG